MDYMHRKKATKRSPLKMKPLRMPGQSLQEEIDRRYDKAVESIVLMVFASVMALLEWSRWYFKSPPMPKFYTFLAVLACLYGIRKIILTRRDFKALKQGRDGERLVGQYLERLRESGYRVLHDIVGNGFNIDHVLIGPTGVYTIETKTVSKPAKGACEVVCEGETITVNGFTPDRNPVVQARAQANWIRGFLKEMVAKDLLVQPVVLYPGWFVKPQPKGSDVWVLNPDLLPAFLKNEKPALDKRDIQAIEGCLSVYVRNSEVR